MRSYYPPLPASASRSTNAKGEGRVKAGNGRCLYQIQFFSYFKKLLSSLLYFDLVDSILPFSLRPIGLPWPWLEAPSLSFIPPISKGWMADKASRTPRAWAGKAKRCRFVLNIIKKDSVHKGLKIDTKFRYPT